MPHCEACLLQGPVGNKNSKVLTIIESRWVNPGITPLERLSSKGEVLSELIYFPHQKVSLFNFLTIISKENPNRVLANIADMNNIPDEDNNFKDFNYILIGPMLIDNRLYLLRKWKSLTSFTPADIQPSDKKLNKVKFYVAFTSVIKPLPKPLS